MLKDTQDSKPDSSHARNEARKSSREGGSKLKGIICEQPVQCGLVETRRSEEVEKRDSDSDDECVDDSSGKEEVVEASGTYVRTYVHNYLWQSHVENERYSTVSGRVISLECFIEITLSVCLY